MCEREGKPIFFSGTFALSPDLVSRLQKRYVFWDSDRVLSELKNNEPVLFFLHMKLLGLNDIFILNNSILFIYLMRQVHIYPGSYPRFHSAGWLFLQVIFAQVNNKNINAPVILEVWTEPRVSSHAKCPFFFELLTNDSKNSWFQNLWKSTSGIVLLKMERHTAARRRAL